MHEIYKIKGADHQVGSDKSYLSDPNYFPDFQSRLEDFKKLIVTLVEGKFYCMGNIIRYF